MFDLTPDRKELLETQGHILVLGGPGSGKTTIALIKADHEIRSARLKRGQHILFLSFARATVVRIAQQAGRVLSGKELNELEINTYHGFAWSLLQSHGYLLNNNNPIRLLPPPEAAARLADIELDARSIEKRRLFADECLLHFDLFAAVSSELLSRSRALNSIICDTYPIIILDEFQDTNSDEWQMIQILGGQSRLIALADAEQRIYEFRGADPRRIGEFIQTYSPTSFDFGSENNRSNGTDIAIFGNDLLTGANKTKKYKDVVRVFYGFYKGRGAHYQLKTALIQGIKRQRNSGNDAWSIAVLVPTKKLMLAVSDYLLAADDKLPIIRHDVSLDTEGPALAAVLIAGILKGGITKVEIAQQMILDLCTHIRGRRGNDSPNQGELELAGALVNCIHTKAIRGKKRQQIMTDCYSVAGSRLGLQFSGDPEEDWSTVRKLLSKSTSNVLQQVAEDTKYLRLLHKGSMLRTKLGDL